MTTSRAGLILMGGGADVDAAFTWQRDRIGGGDVVVLRTSLADGYNSYLFEDIGGVDSVETLRVDTRALADDPYVRWTLDHAEAIFLAGGDQATYVNAWRGTAVAEALQRAPQRGAVIGGTSAGCAFLGEIVYSAQLGSVVTAEALADPYDSRVTLEHDVLALTTLSGVVTDTHFAARDRMGRLLAFTARAMADGLSARPLGVGVDEATAVVVDEMGEGTVVGSGSVYVIVGDHAPTRCTSGQPLAWSNVPLYELRAGDSITFPSGATQAPVRMISASGGTLSPGNPY
ncbi:MAG: cyanophycinase [Deltaproteobacteria bacterium]|nr:cyanophycinase [Deltaproteobacteria bacterium]